MFVVIGFKTNICSSVFDIMHPPSGVEYCQLKADYSDQSKGKILLAELELHQKMGKQIMVCFHNAIPSATPS